MYMYTYVHIHMYMYTYVHLHMYMYTYVHLHMYMYTYVHLHMYMYTYVHFRAETGGIFENRSPDMPYPNRNRLPAHFSPYRWQTHNRLTQTCVGLYERI